MVDQLVYQSVVPVGNAPVLGIAFSSLTREMLVRHMLFEPVPAGEGARLVVTANVDHISNLSRNRRFRAAYAGAWTATTDGMPVYLYARLRGSAVPERVTGADLSSALLDRIRPGQCRPFFVVSQAVTGRLLQAALLRRGFAADAIAIACPKYGFENDPAASAVLAGMIRAHRASHVFFGLGAPKSEVWLHEHRHLIGDAYALSIGASLDFYVGVRRRAPRWMRDNGLEWAWRVLSEPKRLFKRYFIESWFAVWAVLVDLFSSRFSPLEAPAKPQRDVGPA